MNQQDRQTLLETCREITGPVIFNYVCWILTQALELRISSLYFLARDGYSLWRIARALVEKFRLPIRCNYLYCSRNSLRIPSYHLIGEEAYDLMLLGGYHVTVNRILDRIALPTRERQIILAQAPIEAQSYDAVLSRKELEAVSSYLRSNEIFRQYTAEQSRRAYPAAIGYLRQEGMLDGPDIAIVDSGWTGSMQRSLRQLLQSAGFRGRMTGFYFGLYTQPKDPCDGTYLTWYFRKTGNPWDKIRFNNNVFECMLSAPHGMTLSYRERGDRFVPEFAPGPGEDQLERIYTQLSGIMDYTAKALEDLDFSRFSAERAMQDTKKRLTRFMAAPSRREAEVYGSFSFDDDVRDSCPTPLADAGLVPQLRGYSFLRRVLRRLSRDGEATPELFWPCGVIAFLPKWKQPWRRWNVYAWDLLKYLTR